MDSNHRFQLDNSRLIYSAGYRIWLVKAGAWLGFVAMLGMTALGWELIGSPLWAGEPVDDQTSTSEALMLLAATLIFGLAFFAGFQIFARLYVAEIRVSDDGQWYRFTLAGWIRSPVLVVPTISAGERRFYQGFSGKLTEGGIVEGGPETFYTQKIPGRKLPLIIDGQGKFYPHSRT